MFLEYPFEMLPGDDTIDKFPNDEEKVRVMVEVADQNFPVIKRVEREGQEMWQCDTCSYANEKRSSIRRHYNAMHSGKEVTR